MNPTEPSLASGGTSARYGTVGDHFEWQAAIALYDQDRVVEARDLALRLGTGATGAMTGWFRLFEAEAEARERSEVVSLADWLDLEFAREDVGDLNDLRAEILAAMDEMAARLGWSHGPKVRISILGPDADAPWAIGRYGYMVPKADYDKICLPSHVLGHSSALKITLQHEYAHVIVRQGSQGKAPDWLDEGIAMLAEPRIDPAVVAAFANGRHPWLSPTELNQAFHAERRNGENSVRVHMAYMQAALLVRYVVGQCQELRVARLLEGFVNNPNWQELWMRVTGQPYADEALREVYGIGESELFDLVLSTLSDRE